MKLVLDLAEDLANNLKSIAAAQNKTVQELAIEQLASLDTTGKQSMPGSPAAILRALQHPPHLDSADVDELDAVIAGGRLPVRAPSLF